MIRGRPAESFCETIPTWSGPALGNVYLNDVAGLDWTLNDECDENSVGSALNFRLKKTICRLTRRCSMERLGDRSPRRALGAAHILNQHLLQVISRIAQGANDDVRTPACGDITTRVFDSLVGPSITRTFNAALRAPYITSGVSGMPSSSRSAQTGWNIMTDPMADISFQNGVDSPS